MIQATAHEDRWVVFRRWLKFNSVGAIGIGVQLSVLTLLAGHLGLNYLLATALAVETAVLHNFVWHEKWTWADRFTSSTPRVNNRSPRVPAASSPTTVASSSGGARLSLKVNVTICGT